MTNEIAHLISPPLHFPFPLSFFLFFLLFTFYNPCFLGCSDDLAGVSTNEKIFSASLSRFARLLGPMENHSLTRCPKHCTVQPRIDVSVCGRLQDLHSLPHR